MYIPSCHHFTYSHRLNIYIYIMNLLILLDGDPQCKYYGSNAVLENQMISFGCFVSYRGIFAPVMQFMQNNVTTLSGQYNYTTVDQSYYNVTFSVERSLNGASISCFTYFNQVRIPIARLDTNIPTYTHNAPCGPALNILCRY